MGNPLDEVFRDVQRLASMPDAEGAEPLWRELCCALTQGLTGGAERQLTAAAYASLPSEQAYCWAALLQAIAWMQLGYHAASGQACVRARQTLPAESGWSRLFLASLGVHEAWYYCRVGQYRRARFCCYDVLDRRHSLPRASQSRLAAEAGFVLAYTAYRERRIQEALSYAHFAEQQANETWDPSGLPALRDLLLTSGMNLPLLKHQIALFEWRFSDLYEACCNAFYVAMECPHLYFKVIAKHARAELYANHHDAAREKCLTLLKEAGWVDAAGSIQEPSVFRHVESCLDALHYLIRTGLIECDRLAAGARAATLREMSSLLQVATSLLDEVGNPREEIVYALLEADLEQRRDNVAAARECLERAWQSRLGLPDDQTMEYKIQLVKARVDRADGQPRHAAEAYRSAVRALRLIPSSRLRAAVEAEYAEFLEPTDPALARLYWAEMYDWLTDPGDPLYRRAARRVETWSPKDWCQVVSLATSDARDTETGPSADFASATRQEVLKGLLEGIEHDLNQEYLGLKALKRPSAGSGRAVAAVAGAMDRVRELADRAIGLARSRRFAWNLQQEPCDVLRIVQNACASVEDRARSILGGGIELDPDPGAPLPAVRIDPTYLERGTRNILVNALDALELMRHASRGRKRGGGPTSRNRDLADSRIVVRTRTEGKGVRICIWNNNTHIPDEIERKLFTLGNTSGRGHGTGLFFARLAVLLGNGSICGGNVPGGVAFHIWLPFLDKGG